MSPFKPCFASILLLTASLAACDEDQPEPTPRVVHELRTTRALAAAEVDRALAEKLAGEQRLRVDVEVPSDADEVRYLLFSGELAAPPATFGALKAELGTYVMREVMHGGQDARRSVVFRDVAEGTYTVCVAAGPPMTAQDRAVIARAVELVEADGDAPLSGEKLQAAVAAAQAEVGGSPRGRVDWDAIPVRCRRVDVDAHPESRIAAFDPA